MLTTALILLTAQAPAAGVDADRPIVEWLTTASISIPDSGPVPEALDAVFKDIRVVGLGEATHGQHETFELKRKLTMHLVEKHGFRIVAYEASSSRARACDDYIAGRTEDQRAGLGGLGTMIWMIEENAALLEDLRAWNAAARPEDRVRFVGVDVQDAQSAAGRLYVLLEKPAQDLADRARPLGKRIEDARTKLNAGDAAPFDALWPEVEALRTDLRDSRKYLADRASAADLDEADLRASELSRCLNSARDPSGRDRAMGEMLLDELARAGDDSRAVVWSHNAHVSNGPMRYMESTEPGLGGVVREKLGARYYAVGVLFGEGGFHVLDRDANRRLGFRGYAIPGPPPGSLEAPFVAASLATAFVDLRGAPKEGPVAHWIATGHGQRWFGGYGIDPDYATRVLDAEQLLKTMPGEDFDGLAFIPRTTPSRPRDPANVLRTEPNASETR